MTVNTSSDQVLAFALVDQRPTRVERVEAEENERIAAYELKAVNRLAVHELSTVPAPNSRSSPMFLRLQNHAGATVAVRDD